MVNWKMTAIYFGRKWDKQNLILNLIKSFWRSIAKFKIVEARKIWRTCMQWQKNIPAHVSHLTVNKCTCFSIVVTLWWWRRTSFSLLLSILPVDHIPSASVGVSFCPILLLPGFCPTLATFFQATARGPLRAFFVESAHGVDFCRRANVIRWPIRQSRSGHFTVKKAATPSTQTRVERKRLPGGENTLCSIE